MRLEDLNDSQKRQLNIQMAALLIIAGAGSGKYACAYEQNCIFNRGMWSRPI